MVRGLFVTVIWGTYFLVDLVISEFCSVLIRYKATSYLDLYIDEF